jgi:hypothetical protein
MGATNQGLNYVLNLIFPTSPQGWYIGLINNSPVPTLQATDTMAQVGGTNLWSEIPYSTGYSGNRQLWTNGSAASQQVTNASFVAFAMLNTYSIYGIMLCSVATGTSGTLFGTIAFVGGPQSVVNTDTLDVTLTVVGASS